MFTTFATSRVFGRRQIGAASRVYPFLNRNCHPGGGIHADRAEKVLVCRWQQSSETGKLECVWGTERIAVACLEGDAAPVPIMPLRGPVSVARPSLDRNETRVRAGGAIRQCDTAPSAVSLSTAYAIGDVLSLKHSLHRKPQDAKSFYGVYFGLIILAAALVLAPNTPLGLLTNAVQTLAGVLLPSATVFLLLLCNDRAVLGPWVNSRRLNVFTGAIIAVLVLLSLILTLSVIFPNITGIQIATVLIGSGIAAAVLGVWARLATAGRGSTSSSEGHRSPSEWDPATWRMRPLDELPTAQLTTLHVTWLVVLRAYLVIAGGLVLARIIALAIVG
jgi:hypothetical protein